MEIVLGPGTAFLNKKKIIPTSLKQVRNGSLTQDFDVQVTDESNSPSLYHLKK